MIKAEKATVEWDPKKKLWHVRVQIGEEVIKRPLAKTPHDATEEALRAKARETAIDEGYEVDAAQIVIQR